MQRPLRAAAAWLLASALAPLGGASRLASEAGFHPKHHGGHKFGRVHHGAKHPGKAPKKAAVPAASALQAPHAPSQPTVPPPAPTEKALRSAPAVQQPPPPQVPAEEEAPLRAALPAVATSLEPSPPGPRAAAAPAGSTQLPAVSSMLGSAAETLKQISSQASVLEARVVQTQRENEARMARQKAVFEQKLKEQEQENKEIDTVNTGISQEIGNLKKTNMETEKHAKELQSTNHMMRVELSTLKAKLAVSREFLASSLLSTDDSKASELDVLEDAKAKKQRKEHQAGSSDAQAREKQDKEVQDEDGADDDDAEDADGDDEGEARGTSFLALRSSTLATGGSIVRADGSEEASDISDAADPPAADPRDLLKVLSTGVDSLEQEEKESESKLKAMFLANFRDGTKRRKGLLLQQKQLNSTRATLLDYQAKLNAADRHLQGTRAKLEQRLHGLGAFLQRLAAVAAGPVASADQQLKDMPAGVTIPDGPADGADGAMGSAPEAAQAIPPAEEEAPPPGAR